MRTTTIRQALQYVADNPELNTEELISVPVNELVARTLFEIANTVTPLQSRTLSRANRAREMILLRLGGKRKAGSHPATRRKNEIKFVSLTGELEK